MIKNPSVVRQYIDEAVMMMLDRLRIRASMWLHDEHDVLKGMDRSQHHEHSIAITKALFERLGGEVTAPKDPRFCKTRRALAKKRGRPPRGLSKSEKVGLRNIYAVKCGPRVRHAAAAGELIDQQLDAVQDAT